MARSKNTAANELIARTSGGETSHPSARMAALPGEATAALPLPSPPDPMHTTLPVTMPVAAPFEARSPSLSAPYPVVSRSTFESVVAAPVPVGAPPDAPHGPPAATWPAPAPAAAPAASAWAEATQLIDPRHRPRRQPQNFVGTVKMRHSELRIVVGKLVLPMVLLVITGIVIGGYVVFSGDGKPPEAPREASRETSIDRAAAAPIAHPAPIAPVTPAAAPVPDPASDPAPAAHTAPAAAAPVVAEPAAAPPEVDPTSAAPDPRTATLVDVRIDSTPSGAAVTLVDRGKSQYVGNTPVNATVDASLEYDLVFAYPNKPTQVEHLDARTTRHVAVTLGPRAGVARPAVTPPHLEKVGTTPGPAAPVTPPAPAVEPAGTGTLMISSKPPCEILVDGKPTGLTTPQTAITLPAGTHKITLVNSDKAINRTVSVQITANTTEKVIEDLMK
jgi:PEGA domain